MEGKERQIPLAPLGRYPHFLLPPLRRQASFSAFVWGMSLNKTSKLCRHPRLWSAAISGRRIMRELHTGNTFFMSWSKKATFFWGGDITEQESAQMSRGCASGTRMVVSQQLEVIQPLSCGWVLQSELKYTGMLFLTGANLHGADGTRQETHYKMYSEAGEFITQNTRTCTDYKQCKNRHQVSNFIFPPLQAQKLTQPYV